MTRQTLRDFLRSTGRVESSISIHSDPDVAAPTSPDPAALAEGDDLGVDPNTGLPLLRPGGGPSIAGDYASFITSRNTFSLGRGTKLAPSPVRGQSLEDADVQGANSVFAGPTSARQLSTYSNSGYFEEGSRRLSDVIDKTAGTGPGGNDLLKTASTRAEARNTAQVYSEAAYSRDNSYDSENRFADYGTTAEVDTRNKFRVQRKLGDWQKQDGQDSNTSVFEDLKKIGSSLLLKASHRDASDEPGSSVDPDSSAAFSAGSDAVSATNFDTMLSERLLRAISAFGSPAFEDGSSFRGGRGDFAPEDPDARYSKSHGVNFTSTTPADQTMSNESSSPDQDAQKLESSVRLAAASIVILSKLLRQIYSESVGSLEFNKRQSLGIGPYKLGYSVKEDYSALELAHFRSIFPNTAPYTFDQCFSAAFEGLFGVKPPDSAVDVLTASASQTFGRGELASVVSGRLLTESPSFWISIAKSAIYAYTRTKKSATPSRASDSGTNFAKLVLEIGSLRAVRFMAGMITIGYTRLVSTGGSNGSLPFGPIPLDNVEETPMNRLSRTRDSKGSSPNAGSWRGNALPSIFRLPASSISSGPALGNTIYGANPARAMIGSTLVDKTVVDPQIGGRNSRLPIELVHLIENKLEAEYTPFYVQDLRTNEVIAFHAFLETVTDGFSTSYTSTKSYGRADPVYSYNSTTRSISVTFSIVSTNREDFDEMWFKINKLTTLMYPQYTKGEKIKGKTKLLGYEFEAPFSQVYGAPPVIRMRIGDLIKSNYSKLAAARLFGLGSSKDFNIKTITEGGAAALATQAAAALGSSSATVGGIKVGENTVNLSVGSILDIAFLALTASPAVALSESLNMVPSKLSGGSRTFATAAVPFAESSLYDALALLDRVDGRGYINPFTLSYIRNRIIDPQSYKDTGAVGIGSDPATATGPLGGGLSGAVATIFPVTSGWNTKPDGTGEKIIFYQPLKGILTDKIKASGDNLRETGGNSFRGGKDLYEIRIIEGDLQGKTVWVPRGGFSFDTQGFMQILFALSNPLAGGLDYLQSLLTNNTQFGSNAPNTTDSIRQALDVLTNPVAAFFSSVDTPFFDKNEVIAGYEKTMGRGLAGVIENMSFGWDFAWETDFGARAPIGCKVTLKFSPIHDIPPGLDADGFNRAPVYNVGRIMNDFAGDPIDRETGARASFASANKQVK